MSKFATTHRFNFRDSRIEASISGHYHHGCPATWYEPAEPSEVDFNEFSIDQIDEVDIKQVSRETLLMLLEGSQEPTASDDELIAKLENQLFELFDGSNEYTEALHTQLSEESDGDNYYED